MFLTFMQRIIPPTWARPSKAAQSAYRQSVGRPHDHDLDDAKSRLRDLERREQDSPTHLKLARHYMR